MSRGCEVSLASYRIDRSAAPVSGEGDQELEHGAAGRENMAGSKGEVQEDTESLITVVDEINTIQESVEGNSEKIHGGDVAQEDPESQMTMVDGEDAPSGHIEAKLRDVYGKDAPPLYRLEVGRFE